MKTYKAAVFDVVQLMFEKFNDHCVHCVMNFDGRIDENCLKKAVDMSADAFPIIKCRFVEESYFKFPYWEECNFKSNDMVHVIETDNVQKTIERIVVQKIDEKRDPQISVNIIREGKSDSLCIIMNHMITDGAGFKEYLYMLSSIYSHLKNGRKYVPESKNISRGTEQIFKNFSMNDKFKIISSSAKLSKYDNGVTFPLTGDKDNPFIFTRKISSSRFLRIKSFAKENSATINDVILSAYIRTLHKVLGINHIPIPCAVDLRKYLPGRKAEGICNLTSNIVCDIGEDIGKTFRDTLLKVKCEMDAEKKSYSCLNGPFMLENLFRTLPYKTAKKILGSVYKNPPIAMTNIGIIDKNKLMFDELNIKDVFICGSIKYKPYFQIAITTFDNEVTLSINFCGTESDRKNILNFLCMFDNELPY